MSAAPSPTVENAHRLLAEGLVAFERDHPGRDPETPHRIVVATAGGAR